MGRLTLCSLKYKPHALHTGSPKPLRRHKDVLVVEQLEHERPDRRDCVYQTEHSTAQHRQAKREKERKQVFNSCVNVMSLNILRDFCLYNKIYNKIFEPYCEPPLILDKRSIVSIHFVVKSTGVTQIMSGSIPSPQRGRNGAFCGIIYINFKKIVRNRCKIALLSVKYISLHAI